MLISDPTNEFNGWNIRKGTIFKTIVTLQQSKEVEKSEALKANEVRSRKREIMETTLLRKSGLVLN